MRFSFKKALASVLSVALVLSTFVGVLSVNAAEATVVGSFSIQDVAVKANQENEFDVVANIALNEASSLVEVAFQLSDLPEGISLKSVSAGENGTASIIEDPFVIWVSAQGPVAAINVTMTFVASDAAALKPFTLAVAKLDYADTNDNPEDDETLDIAGASAEITFTHDCVDGELVNNGDNHSVKCDICGEVIRTEPHDFSDGKCPCGAEQIVDCEHVYGKVYMNKEAHTWHQNCVNCGSPIEAEEVVYTGTLISNALYFADSVGNTIGINRATSTGLVNKGYADYYIEVEYEAYGDGYVVDNKIKPFLPTEFAYQNEAKTVDYFRFTNIALYEMAKEFTTNLYLLDAEGDVIAVNRSTTSIQALALSYAAKYSSDKALLTALADMIKYGAVVQEYFAAQNPGTAIDGAKLPTEGFEAYIGNASTEEDLPASFNTTSLGSNVLSTTKAQIARPTLLIGASNSLKMSIKANKTDNYAAENLKVVATYTNSYGNPVEDEVNFTKLEVSDGTNTVYTYVFNKLALYDLEQTVTISVYNNGVEEYKYEYCVGYYANQYINNAQLGGLIKAMVLFGQSARIKLVGA